MSPRNLLVTISRSSTWRLLFATMTTTTLAACVAPTSVVNPADSVANKAPGNALLDSSFTLSEGAENKTAEDGSEENTDGKDVQASKASASDYTQGGLCAEVTASTENQLAPQLSALSAPDNAPVFEQFNFRPQSIAVSVDEITVNTAYHTFSYCKETDEWAIADRPSAQAELFDYEQYLQDLADPGYETIQIDNQTYEYRVRLQAPWLDKQIKKQTQQQGPESLSLPSASSTTTQTQAIPSTTSEEVVYFEIKPPDGKLTAHPLYTLTDVQNASIGASLGIPSIANAVETDDAIWFAATTSQGEGENGFASLISYDLETKTVDIHQPPELQGDQITAIVATTAQALPDQIAPEQTDPDRTEPEADPQNETSTNPETDNELTLWIGTLRSAEGNPFFPAHGLVAYQPTADGEGTIRQYTIDNSPLVGAIPYQLATTDDDLWVGTGNGVCQTQWSTIDDDTSWRCWQFTATAALPDEGVDLYQSFLAEDPATKLTDSEVEVLWANWEHFDQPDVDRANAFRYEVVYKPGFEVDLAQGGHRLENKVAQRMAGGNDLFWPGQHWHWSGNRFERSLDEVALNLVGGGPYGLMASNIQIGFSFDHYAIRGNFDLLSLKPSGTRVRYYSGWVEGKDLEAYPKVVEVEPPETVQPDPIDNIAADLPPIGP